MSRQIHALEAECSIILNTISSPHKPKSIEFLCFPKKLFTKPEVHIKFIFNNGNMGLCWAAVELSHLNKMLIYKRHGTLSGFYLLLIQLCALELSHALSLSPPPLSFSPPPSHNVIMINTHFHEVLLSLKRETSVIL